MTQAGHRALGDEPPRREGAHRAGGRSGSADRTQGERDARLHAALGTLLGDRAAVSPLVAAAGGLERLFAPDLAARLVAGGLSSGEAARAAELLDAARNVSAWWPAERPRVQSPGDLAAIATPLFGRSAQEELHIAVVDGRNGLLDLRRVYVGTATGTSVRIAELLRPVIALGGVGFAAVHNHPSGDPQPSDEDLRLTGELLAAARLLDLELLDHLVVGHGRWASIRALHGSIWGG